MLSKWLCLELRIYFLIDFRGMNCLHVLATNCKENAQHILDNILKYHPTFPLDIQDEQGNTGWFQTKFFS